MVPVGSDGSIQKGASAAGYWKQRIENRPAATSRLSRAALPSILLMLREAHVEVGQLSYYRCDLISPTAGAVRIHQRDGMASWERDRISHLIVTDD